MLYWPFFWQLPLDSNIRGAGRLRDDINLGLRSLSYECDIWRSGEIPLKSGSRCPCHGFDHPVNTWLVWPFFRDPFQVVNHPILGPLDQQDTLQLKVLWERLGEVPALGQAS